MLLANVFVSVPLAEINKYLPKTANRRKILEILGQIFLELYRNWEKGFCLKNVDYF